MKVGILIAGGGLAGLACARELHSNHRPYLLVERERALGGLCRSVECGGFTFDYTGHFLHFKDPGTRRRVLSMAPGLFKMRERRAAVFSHGTYTEYPYQENCAGLPPATAMENVTGYLEACLKRREPQARKPREDFRSWCLEVFGKGISRNFLFPYNQKLWKTPLSRLTASWVGRFVPRPGPGQVAEGAWGHRPSRSGYNAVFHYPDHGGISRLPGMLARGLPGLFTGVALRLVDPSRRTALLSTGLSVRYDHLVSSLPLPLIVRMMKGAPARLLRSASVLKVTSVYNINFGLKPRQAIPYSWIYFPEPGYDFHRAGSVSACVPGAAPSGRSTLYLEYSYRGHRPDRHELGRKAVRHLHQLGWIASERDIAVRMDLDLPLAYVLYDPRREEATGELLRFLQKRGIHSVGRYGRWEYGTMESAMEQGWEAARACGT